MSLTQQDEMIHASDRPDQAGRLWREYRGGRSEQARNDLLVHYLPLAKSSAHRVAERLPGHVDPDDLMQSAIFGLRDAIASFDPERGVKFETYCAARVRGAMLDSLRSVLCAPREIRQRTARLGRVTEELEMELGRRPTEEEAACRLGVPVAEFRAMLREAQAGALIGLAGEEAGESGTLETVEDSRADDPATQLQRQDLKELILRELSQTERLVLLLYYYEELSMREIGATLGVSESRVSQVHGAVLQRLRRRLNQRRRAVAGETGWTVDL